MSTVANKQRAKLLFLSIFVNVALLFYFKYLMFFTDSFIALANVFGVQLGPIILNIILPLGISFYTFQTISYTVDVYRRHIDPERNFLLYACYVTFFPQLVAGPILRAREVVEQLVKRKSFGFEHIIWGVRRILYGLFLKVVLADNIAPVVDQGYALPIEAMSALDVWTLAFLFGFQIYFDFSAYSHIALGSARLLGIFFPENFNFPYMASSPRDFWRRWHISLSSWIRDYLYLPLTGTKVLDKSSGGLSFSTSKDGNSLPLYATWAIMGLWHGASWTFVLWGVYHALIISIYRLLSPLSRGVNERLKTVGGVILTLPLMMLGWIPFRAESLDQTFGMWIKIFDISGYFWLGMRENTYLITFILLLGLILFSLLEKVFFVDPRLQNWGQQLLGFTAITVMVAAVIVFLRPISQFIYFQF
jgi:D-alanyl-lipoteichoic acid acyltransferase DltB (MBOAT superfamily)